MESRGLIRLLLLGEPALESPGRDLSGVLVQPKRLALLSYLAVQAGYVRRDALVTQFWSDLDQDRARRTLSQAIHFLRRQLGRDAISSRGSDEVAVSPDHVWCDVAAFEAAAGAGEWERALELYRGDLLEGLNGDQGTTEFSHWLDGERLRLQQSAARAATARAEECFRVGDLAGALRWQRRALEVKPLDEALLRDHLALLDEAGDTAQALSLYESFRDRLARDFDLRPSIEMVRLIDRIRRRRPGIPAAAERRSEPEPAPTAESSEQSGAAERGRRLVARGAGRLQGDRLTSRAWIGLAAIATLAGVLFFQYQPGWVPRSVEGMRSWAPNRVAVTYLDVVGDSTELGYLADGLTEALIQYLSEFESLDVVSSAGVRPFRRRNAPIDTIAARVRAGLILKGSVQQSGGTTQVNIELVDASSGSVIESTPLRLDTTEPFAIIDSVTAVVSRELAPQIGDQMDIRRWRAGTRSEQAWRLAVEASELHKSSVSYASVAGTRAALAKLVLADSILDRASGLDPAWQEPILLRAQVIWRKAFLCFRVDTCDAVELMRRAIAQVDRVIATDPRAAAAYELRGDLRFKLWVFEPDDTLLAGSETDSRTAITLDQSRAVAWNTLSSIQFDRGDLAGSRASAAKALEEDYFLADRSEILGRLFEATFNLDRDDDAEYWCSEIRLQQPNTLSATTCELSLAAWSTERGQPDISSAWREVAAMKEHAVLDTWDSTEPNLELLVGAVIARAGRADSADAVIARALSRAHDSEALMFAAAALNLRGRTDEARGYLARYLESGAASRRTMTRHRWLRDLEAAPGELSPLESASGFPKSRSD